MDNQNSKKQQKITNIAMVLVLLIGVVAMANPIQFLRLDDFEDGNLVAENYAYWLANSSGQSENGQVLDCQNVDDGSGNRAAYTIIQAGIGTWRAAELVLKLAWDEFSRPYKSEVVYGYDLRDFQAIRFRAKGSPGGYARLVLASDFIPNYQYYYAGINLSEDWAQFEIDFSQLISDQTEISLDTSLQRTDMIQWATYPSDGQTVQIWVDDVELIYKSNWQPPEPVDIPVGLRQAAQQKNMQIGLMPMGMHLTDQPLMDSIDVNADYLLGGWEMCQATIQRSPYYWDFAMPDALLEWAVDHSKPVNGQHLIWHGGTPDWIKNGGYDAETLHGMMKDFIEKSIAHYQANYPGTVTHYSVVNEAIDDNTHTYRSSVWYDTLGADFIADAFRYAHAMAPDAKLYYNDYGIDGINAKSDAVYAMVSHLLEEGVPIHGIGLQMHIFEPSWFPGKQSLLDNMQRFGQLGLEVYVTETDIAINQDQTGLTDEKLQQQAAIYRQIMEACVESPYCHDFGFWGISDKYSWIIGHKGHDDWPLILDEAFQPKPAWCALIETFLHAGDLDSNCRIDLNDVAILASQWLMADTCEDAKPCADLGGSPRVDLVDFSIMGQHY